MMAPDQLRRLSWLSFKITVYCAAAGIMLLTAIPAPGFKASFSTAAHVIGLLAIAALGVSFLANALSLGTGALAWSRGSGPCYWILVSLMLLLAAAGLGLMAVM